VLPGRGHVAVVSAHAYAAVSPEPLHHAASAAEHPAAAESTRPHAIIIHTHSS